MRGAEYRQQMSCVCFARHPVAWLHFTYSAVEGT